MAFAFEQLKAYSRALDFPTAGIDIIDKIETPRKYFCLIEQREASRTSAALNTSEGKRPLFKEENQAVPYIAHHSRCEILTMIQIFVRGDWLAQKSHEELYSEAEQINKMLSRPIS